MFVACRNRRLSRHATHLRIGADSESQNLVENIGARRLQTVMERALDEVSFTAADRSGDRVKIDAAFIERTVGDLAGNADLSRFIL